MSLALRIATDLLLALGVGLTCLCSIGMLLMRDPLQRLHFVAPPTTLAPLCFALAIALDGGELQAVLKALLVVLLLLVQSGVISHATARSLYIRRARRWPPNPSELGGLADRQAPP